MPLTNQRTTRGDYKHDRALRIPPEARHLYSYRTQQRHAFADWAEQTYTNNHSVVNPRRAVVRYLRQHPDFKAFEANSRWAGRHEETITDLFGHFCTSWLRQCPTAPVADVIARIRHYREDDDPYLPRPIEYGLRGPTQPAPPPDGVHIPEDSESWQRGLLRAVQKDRRLQFCEWLATQRKNVVNPKRIYKRWRGTYDYLTNKPGRRPYLKIRLDAKDVLGEHAALLITTSPNLPISELRTALEAL